jgi:hypothetical protein
MDRRRLGGDRAMNDWTQTASLKGPQGEQGIQGETGPANELTVGTVETLLPTEPATVVITGEPPDQVIDFGIPQGNPGPGAAGENVGTGTGEVFAGADPGTGIIQFARLRQAGIVSILTDANGVQIGAPVPDWAAITGKPSTFPPTLPIAQSGVTNLPGDLAAMDTSIDALVAAMPLKAPLASPVFTGNPTAPTPLTSDNDTSVATTAYVKSAISAAGAVALVSETAPVTPVTGQIWWKDSTEVLSVWNGTAWKPVVATWA